MCAISLLKILFPRLALFEAILTSVLVFVYIIERTFLKVKDPISSLLKLC
jgi:hypothetical protein